MTVMGAWNDGPGCECDRGYVGGVFGVVNCLMRFVAFSSRLGFVMLSQLIRLSVGLNQLFCAPTSL